MSYEQKSTSCFFYQNFVVFVYIWGQRVAGKAMGFVLGDNVIIYQDREIQALRNRLPALPWEWGWKGTGWVNDTELQNTPWRLKRFIFWSYSCCSGASPVTVNLWLIPVSICLKLWLSVFLSLPWNSLNFYCGDCIVIHAYRLKVFGTFYMEKCPVFIVLLSSCSFTVQKCLTWGCCLTSLHFVDQPLDLWNISAGIDTSIV